VTSRSDVAAARQSLRLAQWKRRLETEFLLYWDKPIPLQAPKGLRFMIGPTSDKTLWKQFEEVSDANFGVGANFFFALKKSCDLAPGKHFIVLAQDTNGNPVGAGLVAVRGKYAFLYSSSVVKRWRGKGLWKALVSVRQGYSALLGAGNWITTSFNPQLQQARIGAKKYRIETWSVR
jgi:hypothetical protein